ncbi:MAG: bifunctional diaminohydroxyphosphoribosylaminopyrimidine deaminase/5-amino-6-(5-phosphoribosylamino)uracil reductase RibD [Pseudomonadota bacterium]
MMSVKHPDTIPHTAQNAASYAQDEMIMAHACTLAQQGWGRTGDRPSVGCIIVRKGQIIARARTADGGQPHAEVAALAQAGNAAGTDVYVTLEPCAHHGRTPPCVDALIHAKPARVIIGLIDPDPRTAGQSIEKLKNAGIETLVGCGGAKARRTHNDHIRRIQDARPHITIKIATSLDGQIATKDGHSRWITGKPARDAGHRLRAQHDGILVGSDTLLADNPRLSCRLAGIRHTLRSFVLDRRGRLRKTTTPLKAHDLQVLTDINHLPQKTPDNTAMRFHGMNLAQGPHRDRQDLITAMALIAKLGISRLLIEGGGQIIAQALKAGIVDDLVWFRSAAIIGGDGIPAVAAMDLKALHDTPGLRRETITPIGEDVMEVFTCLPAS